MKHHQPTSADAVLHLAYLPGEAGAFVLQLITRLNGATSQDLKKRVESWGVTELKEAGLALSTKIAMLSLIAGRVYTVLGKLYTELTDHDRVHEYIKGGYGWNTADRRLPYEILLEIDSFIFEFRSCYEMLGTFLRAFFKHILCKNVTQAEILAKLKMDGVETAWAEDLTTHRKLFFHEISPWLAVSVDLPTVGDRELLILYGPNADPTDQAQCLTFSRLRAMYGGFESALQSIHKWALAEIAALDK